MMVGLWRIHSYDEISTVKAQGWTTDGVLIWTILTEGSEFVIPLTTCTMIPCVSMIFFRISSSLAPRDAKHLKAPCLAAGEGHDTMSDREVMRWFDMAANLCSVVSTWKETSFIQYCLCSAVSRAVTATVKNRLAIIYIPSFIKIVLVVAEIHTRTSLCI